MEEDEAAEEASQEQRAAAERGHTARDRTHHRLLLTGLDLFHSFCKLLEADVAVSIGVKFREHVVVHECVRLLGCKITQARNALGRSGLSAK